MGTALFSCKKDDPTEGTPIVNLTSESGEKTWKLVGGKAFAPSPLGGSLEIDLIQNYACLADNQLVLRSDFSYTLNDTGEKCSSAEVINDKWVLVESPLQIRLAQISLLDRTLANVVLDMTNLTATSFGGDINSVPENPYGITKISLTFEVLK